MPAAPKPRCLETRREGVLTMRRYEKPNGRRVKTMELPWAFWLRVRSRVMKDMPSFLRTEAARDRKAEIKQMLAAGEKQDYVADVMGVSQQYVAKVNRERKAAEKT